MRPSDTGTVSSNTLAFVKLRIEKLSSHFSGQGKLCPCSSYITRIFRANIPGFCYRHTSLPQPYGQANSYLGWQHSTALQTFCKTYRDRGHPALRPIASRPEAC